MSEETKKTDTSDETTAELSEKDLEQVAGGAATVTVNTAIHKTTDKGAKASPQL